MSKILSGKVKKIPSTQVSADRYNFLSLGEAEPDLGVPVSNNYVLSSDTNGNRTWISVTAASGGSDSFKNIAVSGQDTLVADSTEDTLTLVAGTGIGISTNATTDTLSLRLNVPTSVSPPTSPTNGILWWDSTFGQLKIYYSDGDSSQWVDATGAWTSSEDFNLLAGKVYEINGVSVLSSTTLGSGVTSSSLTSVGTISTGTWQGTLISPTYGGTGVNNGTRTITLGGNLTTSGAFNSTFTMTAATSVTFPTSGTLATTANIGNGTLTLNIGAAAATNNTVTVGTGTGFTANTSTNTTYSLSIGPALTALASTMTGAGTGFLRKTAADTFTLDTNTYLTSQSSDFGTFSIGADSGYTWGVANTNTSQIADTIGDTLTLVNGGGINLYTNTVAGTDAIKIEHADTSSAANLTASSRTYVTGLTFDTYGHVTAYTTASETVTDTNTTYTLDGSGTTNSVNLELVAGGSGSGTDSINVVGSGISTVSWDEANQRMTITSTEADTLASVTGRGATTATAISLTNVTDASSTTSGALIVSGGVGIAKNLHVGVDLVVGGNLTINGTTTTINATTITVDDKNIELGSVDSPTDITADGGGITLKGTTDKTITWSSIGWTSSEDFNLVSGKVYEINGTAVLSATTLGSGVTGSSLTSVGTISTGTWQGSLINSTYGGTGVNNGGRTITLNTGNLTLTAQAAGSSVIVPSTGTLAVLGTAQTFTAAQTFRAASAIRSEAASTQDAVVLAGRAGGTGSFAVTLTPTTLSANQTLTLPNSTGTVALTGDIGNGTLTLSIGAAAATNNTVTVGTGTGFSANTGTNTTYSLSVGPALTNLASTMTGAGTGFLRKNGADTYTLDTSTYLTSQSSDFGTFAIGGTDSGYTWGTANTNTNQVADAVGDTLTFVKGPGINLYTNTVAGTDAIKIEHQDTSSVANLSSDNSNGTVVQDISFTFDTFGHVTAATVGTVDLDARYATTTWTVRTSGYTAINGDKIVANTTGGAFTITLPATPSSGHTVSIADGGTWATNNLTVARNGSTIKGLSQNYVLVNSGNMVDFIYNGTTWLVFNDVSSGSSITADDVLATSLAVGDEF